MNAHARLFCEIVVCPSTEWHSLSRVHDGDERLRVTASAPEAHGATPPGQPNVVRLAVTLVDDFAGPEWDARKRAGILGSLAAEIYDGPCWLCPMPAL